MRAIQHALNQQENRFSTGHAPAARASPPCERYGRDGRTTISSGIPNPRAGAIVRLIVGAAIAFPATRMLAQPKPPVQSINRHTSVNHPSPFATYVIDYTPGDGQFVNDPRFNDPTRALGPPVGGGTIAPDNSKLVTLGDHGGSITLGFDMTVWDHPDNPFGLDGIVFGNASWVGGNPNVRWGEAAIIEISRDVNRNGFADDPWYLIPGSDIHDPRNQKRNGFFVLPDDPFATPPIVNTRSDGTERYWGYGDMSPVLLLGDVDGDNVVDRPNMRPEMFYTAPDDPSEVGITPGSGGGDAFDIAWAVDPATNEPADLEGFDFLRITTGADGEAGQFGEVSTEVGGVAAVQPWLQRPGLFLRRFVDRIETDGREAR